MRVGSDTDVRQKGSVFDPLNINLDGLVWEACGNVDPMGEDDPRSRLLAVVKILGVHHHLEAYEVAGEGGDQWPVNASFEDEFRGMLAISNPDGAFDTVEIEGRQYALTLTPFTR